MQGLKLHNKIALITGGNSGIGLATARIFRAEGASLVIVGQNERTLAQTRDELGEGYWSSLMPARVARFFVRSGGDAPHAD